LDSVLESSGPEVAAKILERLRAHATVNGIDLPFSANTPYANTIPVRLQPLFPGDQELERRIKSLIRWNALAMVVRANRVEHNMAGTFPRMPRRQRSTKWASTIFSERAARSSRATRFIFKGTLHPEFMRARSWKAASARRNWR